MRLTARAAADTCDMRNHEGQLYTEYCRKSAMHKPTDTALSPAAKGGLWPNQGRRPALKRMRNGKVIPYRWQYKEHGISAEIGDPSDGRILLNKGQLWITKLEGVEIVPDKPKRVFRWEREI